MVQIPFQLLSIQFRCRVITSHLERRHRGLGVEAAIMNRSVSGSSPAGEPWSRSCLSFFLPLFHRQSSTLSYLVDYDYSMWECLRTTHGILASSGLYICLTSASVPLSLSLSPSSLRQFCKEIHFVNNVMKVMYVTECTDLFLNLNLTKLWQFKTLRIVQKSCHILWTVTWR